ncbi:MAG: hypothetical protein NTAFB09_08240 [Nitrosospira sp.]
MDEGEMKSQCDAPACSSVFPGQQESGHAAVGFGDDPECVISMAFAGLGVVNGVGGQNPIPRLQGVAAENGK